MENRLKKSGVYGFLIGLTLAILFVDYKNTSNVSGSVSTITYETIFGYIVSILRFGVIGMFIGLIIGWKGYERENKTEKKKSYYLEFFIAVFLIATISSVVFNW